MGDYVWEKELYLFEFIIGVVYYLKDGYVIVLEFMKVFVYFVVIFGVDIYE